MAADAAVSLGVVIAAVFIGLTGFSWIDPVVSLIIVIVITIGTWGLLKESLNLSLDAVPKNIDIEAVQKYFLNLKDVKNIHDLHIWAMSTTETALTAHLYMPDSNVDDDFIEKINNDLRKQFDINHATIQIERTEICNECNMIGNI